MALKAQFHPAWSAGRKSSHRAVYSTTALNRVLLGICINAELTPTFRDQAENEYNQNGAAQSHQDRVDHPARCCKAKMTSDKSAHHCADDAKKQIDPEAVTASLHDFSRSPSGYYTDNDPPQ
jgi:hypothetical protein